MTSVKSCQSDFIAGGEENVGAPADVFFSTDIYDSVVVAAFGGVSQNLAKYDTMKVHPVVMLVLCLPITIAQLSSIMFLFLDQDLTLPVVNQATEEKQTSVRIVLALKLLMVVVLQLSFF